MESYKLNSKVVSGDKEYMIQTLSELNSVWTDLYETNLVGTGDPITHLISTRDGGGQAFYRVVERATAP